MWQKSELGCIRVARMDGEVSSTSQFLPTLSQIQAQCHPPVSPTFYLFNLIPFGLSVSQSVSDLPSNAIVSASTEGATRSAIVTGAAQGKSYHLYM